MIRVLKNGIFCIRHNTTLKKYKPRVKQLLPLIVRPGHHTKGGLNKKEFFPLLEGLLGFTNLSSVTSPMANSTPPKQELEELIRIFNTALVNSKTRSNRNFSEELQSVLQTPAFRVILTSIQKYSEDLGVDLNEAATEVVHTFRNLDQIWSEYVYQEGIHKLTKKSPTSVPRSH
jgi:hypothetical protein